MCFSASVSYSASAVLVATGLYAVKRAKGLPYPYLLLSLTPILFGIQQGLEGRVWQEVGMGRADLAIPFALGFHFFSHFLWLWWFPLCSALLEQGKLRKGLFLGLGTFGALAGGLVFFTLLLHPDWLSVEVEHYSLVYHISSPYRGPFHVPIPASAVYAVIVLMPLLLSTHRHIRIFGGLVVVSVILASLAYGYAFVSVWCFFVAVLSLYLVSMIHQLKALWSEPT